MPASGTAEETEAGPNEADRLLERLLRWCDERGAERSAVAVEKREGRGRCLVAARALVEGELIFRVPPAAVLSDAAGDGRANHVMLGLAHLLLKEDARGDESEFAPLVSFLLDQSRYPFHLEDFFSLPGASGAFAKVRADRNSQFIEKLCSVHPSTKRFLVGRAVEAVNNRAIYDERQKVCALSPLVDLMNHDARPSANWRLAEDRAVEVVAVRALELGEEVTISYGDEPASEMFIAYGFLPSGAGPHRSVDLRVNLHPPELQRYGTQVSAELRVLASGALRSRAAVAPLLQGARAFLEQLEPGGAPSGVAAAAAAAGAAASSAGPRPHEKLAAEAIVRCAKAEECAWLRVLADKREKFSALVEANCECLVELTSRLEKWLAGSREESLMNVLSSGPAAAVVHDDGDEDEDDDDSSSSESAADA